MVQTTPSSHGGQPAISTRYEGRQACGICRGFGVPTRFKPVINLKTAQDLGLTID